VEVDEDAVRQRKAKEGGLIGNLEGDKDTQYFMNRQDLVEELAQERPTRRNRRYAADGATRY